MTKKNCCIAAFAVFGFFALLLFISIVRTGTKNASPSETTVTAAKAESDVGVEISPIASPDPNRTKVPPKSAMPLLRDPAASLTETAKPNQERKDPKSPFSNSSKTAGNQEAENEKNLLEEWKPTSQSLAALIPTPSRKWTGQDGRVVLAVVETFDAIGRTVNLRTASGESFPDFPIDRFSAKDQAYLVAASSGLLEGEVVGVTDGDSLTLLVAGNTQFKIRLEAIDAPEVGQEFGTKSKVALSDLVYGKQVTVRVTGLDKYQRYLGFVIGDGSNINQQMIVQGMVWHFKEYSDDPLLAQAEQSARQAKKGLWSAFNPMSPWDFRALQRSNAEEARAALISTSGPTPPSALKSNAGSSAPESPAKVAPATACWLNTSSYKRHNRACRWYGETKNGRACTASEGSACGICGG